MNKNDWWLLSFCINGKEYSISSIIKRGYLKKAESVLIGIYSYVSYIYNSNGVNYLHIVLSVKDVRYNTTSFIKFLYNNYINEVNTISTVKTLNNKDAKNTGVLPLTYEKFQAVKRYINKPDTYKLTDNELGKYKLSKPQLVEHETNYTYFLECNKFVSIDLESIKSVVNDYTLTTQEIFDDIKVKSAVFYKIQDRLEIMITSNTKFDTNLTYLLKIMQSLMYLKYGQMFSIKTVSDEYVILEHRTIEEFVQKASRFISPNTQINLLF